MMFENILLIIILVMMIYVIFIFMNWIKDIVEIIFKIVSIPKKPKIHIFNSSLEDSDIDPFKEFSDLKNINIGDVLFCKSGSLKGIYWQKVSDKDWITSLELQKLCGGEIELFNNWAEKNKNLKMLIQ